MQRSDIGMYIQGSQEYLVGRNLVHEALKAGTQIEAIFFENTIKEKIGNSANSYSIDKRISGIIAIARKRKIPIAYISKEELRRIEEEVNSKSGGVCAIALKRDEIGFMDFFAHFKNKNKEPFFIIVNNILYEENLGSILRTSAAGGVDCIILPKRDKKGITPLVQKVSMGGSEYVPVIKDNLFTVLDVIQREGIKIIGVELDGDKYYFEADLTGPIALLLGGEDAGVTAPLKKRCDEIVKLPMLGSIQSLNVSVSTGIMIYEKIRQECQN